MITSYRLDSKKGSKTGSVTPDPSSELQIFHHDGDPLGVYGTQIRILEQAYHVCLSRLLQRKQSCSLELDIWLEIMSNLSHQSLERKLAQKEFGAFLVLPDLSQSYGARSVSVGFLDPPMRRCHLPGSFCSQSFSRGLSSGSFSGSLLCSRHVERFSPSCYCSVKTGL